MTSVEYHEALCVRMLRDAHKVRAHWQPLNPMKEDWDFEIDFDLRRDKLERLLEILRDYSGYITNEDWAADVALDAGLSVKVIARGLWEITMKN